MTESRLYFRTNGFEEARDSGFGEKTAAWLVTTAMKTKRKLSLGLKKQQKLKDMRILKTNKKNSKTRSSQLKKIAFGKSLVKNTKEALKSLHRDRKNNTLINSANTARIAAGRFLKTRGGKKKVRIPRVIPKIGGLLPLIPIVAALSALETLASGAVGIAGAVNKVESAQEALKASLKDIIKQLKVWHLVNRGTFYF